MFIIFIAMALAQAKILSVTVAQVGDHVITSREVMISSALDQGLLLTSQPANKVKLEPLPNIASEPFKNQLSMLILEHLVISEADSFSIAQISQEEVGKQMQALADLFKSWPDWKTLAVTTNEMEAQTSRSMRAKSFLRYKTESMGLHISEQEAREYYQKNRVKFGTLPFEKMKGSIREYLSQKNVETKMKDWVQILRKKYHVRMIPYEEIIK
jgi:hypothetical protein